MDFQSILLALFISALIYNVIKALYRPMLENFLRLLCIPIAFIITYVIQALGIFQLIINRALSIFELQSLLGGFGDLYGYISATITTFFAPLFFIGIYSVLRFVLNKLHVKLIIKYINSRNKKRALRDFRNTIREEKEKALARVWESEQRIDQYREDHDMDVGESYANDDLPDEDEIEDIVEKKVGFEKIKLTFKGFFSEGPEEKALSIICGAVSGFLSLGIMLMPFFYAMNFATIVTDAAAQTEAENSKVYKVIQVVDKYIITPYEDTFVVELYDSMGMVDLMVNTVRTSGYFKLEDQKIYPHDVNKHFTKYGVRIAIDVTDLTSKHETLGEDVRQFTMHPLMISIITDGVVYVLNSGMIQEYLPMDPDSSNPMASIPAKLIGFYVDAEDPKTVVRNDVVAMGDMMVVLVKSGIITDIMSQNFDITTLTQSPEMLTEMIGAMSGLSAFPPIMESVFEMGIDMMAGFLQIPADDETAYINYKNDLYGAIMGNDGVAYDMAAIERFVKYAATIDDKILRIKTYENGDDAKADRAAFVAYTTHWSALQNVFSSAGEDTSAGNFTIEIDGDTYVLTDKQKVVKITNPSEYTGKISPVSSLINYLIQNSEEEFASETEIFELIALYPMGADDYAVAHNFVSGDDFVSKAVTIEKLHASMNFGPEWTGDVRKADCEKCVEIITSLLGVMGNMGQTPADEGTDGALAMIEMLPALGKTFDLMAETTCLKDLPPQLLAGFLNNDMMSSFIPAKYVHQINEEVASNPEISYETYLRSWVDTFKLLLGFGGVV